MNKIIANNIEVFINAEGRKKEWIQRILKLDQPSFNKLLAGDTTHLESFAKLFNKDAQYFMNENFEAPETIEERLERLKEYEPEPISDVMYMSSKLEGISDDMRKLEGLFQTKGLEKNQITLDELKNLVNKLETKTTELLIETEKKEIELELNKYSKGATE